MMIWSYSYIGKWSGSTIVVSQCGVIDIRAQEEIRKPLPNSMGPATSLDVQHTCTLQRRTCATRVGVSIGILSSTSGINEKF